MNGRNTTVGTSNAPTSIQQGRYVLLFRCLLFLTPQAPRRICEASFFAKAAYCFLFAITACVANVLAKHRIYFLRILLCRRLSERSSTSNLTGLLLLASDETCHLGASSSIIIVHYCCGGIFGKMLIHHLRNIWQNGVSLTTTIAPSELCHTVHQYLHIWISTVPGTMDGCIRSTPWTGSSSERIGGEIEKLVMQFLMYSYSLIFIVDSRTSIIWHLHHWNLYCHMASLPTHNLCSSIINIRFICPFIPPSSSL
mmetsp:Transcript_1740/g.6110  ORF Transcript_1740/g.6110 Transcript_1740/m.6110 type:complete len:254 (+) Transcript_1740:1330-2091(+)